MLDVCSSDLISGWICTAACVGWRCNAAVGHGRAGAVVVVRGRNEKRFLPGLATVTAAQDPAVVADRQHELVVEEFDLGQSRAALRLHLGLMPRSLDAIGVKDVALFTDREQTIAVPCPAIAPHRKSVE